MGTNLTQNRVILYLARSRGDVGVEYVLNTPCVS